MTSRSKSSPQVHQIKAIFEGYRNALSRPSGYTTRSSSSSYMSKSSTDLTDRKDRADQDLLASEPTSELADTIETIIDIPATTNHRPPLSQKPSWVGPAPPVGKASASHSKVMPSRVPIEYSAANLRPPVFITTSLSEPPWDILEMEAINHPDGQFLFRSEFEAQPGEHQYKLRLGPGDWWVVDESQPTIDDGIGNRNNLLFVPEVKHAIGSHGEAVPSGTVAPATSNNVDAIKTHDGPDKALREDHTHPTELKNADQKPSVTAQTSVIDQDQFDVAEKNAHDDQITDDEDHDAWEAPLMRHETITSTPSRSDDDRVVRSPVTPSSFESSFGDAISPEGDPNDPTLHHFPTNHADIMKELARTRQNLREDYTDDNVVLLRPSGMGGKMAQSAVIELPSVREEQESEDMLLLVNDKEENTIAPMRTPADGFVRVDNQAVAAAVAAAEEQIEAIVEQEKQAAAQQDQHSHHHRTLAEENMLEEKHVNQRIIPDIVPRAPQHAARMAESHLSMLMAAVIVIVAVVMYSIGFFGGHAIKDGGATVID